jgi:hypothetical protein
MPSARSANPATLLGFELGEAKLACDPIERWFLFVTRSRSGVTATFSPLAKREMTGHERPRAAQHEQLPARTQLPCRRRAVVDQASIWALSTTSSALLLRDY